MKIFRRIVFFLLSGIIFVCASILVTAPSGHQSLDSELCGLIFSELGILVWCAIFLQVEPKLARVGLIISIILLCLGIASGFAGALFNLRNGVN
jgi:hypothetical protein